MMRNFLAPGLRFCPTEIELVCYYLKRKIMGKPIPHKAIADVKLYEFSPWDLPALSCLPNRDLEWYFFCPREKRYAQGNRSKRATKNGFWKSTGKDRPILNNSKTVGMIKSLVYYIGKPPKGETTDWIMYEYRLESDEMVKEGYAQDAYVICKLFKKSGKQSAGPFIEEEWEGVDNFDYSSFFASPQTTSMEYGRSSLEVGEASSRQLVSETTTLEPCGNGSEIEGEDSMAPYADGMFIDDVENCLLSSSPLTTMEPGIRLDDIIQMPCSDNDSVYGDLEELFKLPVLDHSDDSTYNLMVQNEPLTFSVYDDCNVNAGNERALWNDLWNDVP